MIVNYNRKTFIVQATGLNLGRVFNYRCGHASTQVSTCTSSKQPDLLLKTRPKQVLGHLTIAFALPAESLMAEWGEISCQFPPPGGSMVSRYFLQLLFIQTVTKLVKTQQPLKLEEKISTDLGSLIFKKFFEIRLTKSKNNQILLHKISHWCLLTMKPITGWKILIPSLSNNEHSSLLQ